MSTVDIEKKSFLIAIAEGFLFESSEAREN